VVLFYSKINRIVLGVGRMTTSGNVKTVTTEMNSVAAEIWRYNDFENGGRPPCWIFEI